MCSVTWDLFLGAGLRQPGCIRRNEQIIQLVNKHGLKIFSPQLEIPLGTKISSKEIVARNKHGIANAKAFLFLPEGAGSGVYYELGFAVGLGKMVIGFGHENLTTDGEVAKGTWQMIEASHRASDIHELEHILVRIFKGSIKQ